MSGELPVVLSVLGCGWLGLPLARQLRERGLSVHGSTTRPERLDVLRESGIKPFLVSATPAVCCDEPAGFFETDALVVNIPPRRSDDVEARHPAEIARIAESAQSAGCRRLIFVSSTSVYAASEALADERNAAAPDKASGRALRAAEGLLLENADLDVSVLRVAGLIGPGRLPGQFLAGKRDVPNGDRPVNLVHRDDVVRAIESVLRAPGEGQVFNVVAPTHPTRRAYYLKAAVALGIEPPSFTADAGVGGKIVDHRKFVRQFGFEYRFPDPASCFA